MMASPFAAIGAALAALVFFTAVGLPLARRLFPSNALALGLAPTIGWAAFTAAALPILCVVGFGRASVAALAAGALAAALFCARRGVRSRVEPGIPALAYVGAALLAAVPAAALLPTYAPDGVLLAAPIFDHSKVAIVDEIVRNGLPAQNPFYGEAGGRSALVYYYLWHVSAAMLSLLPGVSGWEADVGLTGFTAFATISLTMALAVSIRERPSAAWWALALGATASARPLVSAAFGQTVFGTWLSDYPDLAAPLVQVTWAPQHVASAGCVVVALLLIRGLEAKDRLAPIMLGLVAAAAFGSSIWIGGVTFALAAAMAGSYAAAVSERRGRLIARAALALGIALAAASPILIEQARAAAERSGGSPVAFHAYEVFGPSVAEAIRRPLDLIGFWLVQLPVDLPAIVPVGAMALAATLAARGGDLGRRRVATTLALGAAASLVVSWLLVSKILNNDLGWRAVLPGTLVLAAFAAAGLSRWTARPTKALPTLLAIACVLAGAYGGFFFFRDDLAARPSGSAAAFAGSPELWRAARAHSGPTERIASNPGLFADMTQHPINISWALFSDRRSCYAGWEFARPFSGKSAEEVDRTDKEFRAVFDGTASGSAVRELFAKHGCRIAIVTAGDGAWASDAFATDPAFELLDERPGSWRIYRFRPTPPPP